MKWGGLFWATSLEKIFGGVTAIVSYRPGGWMQQSTVPRCAILSVGSTGVTSSETARVHHAARPISNKLLGTSIVKYPFPLASQAKRAPSVHLVLIMRDLFAVPWLTPSRPTLLGVVVLTVLVFGAFARF